MKSLVNSMEKGMLRQIINRTLKCSKHDREKNLIEILTTVEKIAGPLFAGESYQAAKRIIIEPKGKWKSYVESLIKEVDHTVLRTTALNLGFEAAYLAQKQFVLIARSMGLIYLGLFCLTLQVLAI